MRSARTHLSFLIHDLQVLDNSVGARELKVVLSRLESGVADLAVVEDDGEALGAALLVGPADALGELGLGVGKEELRDIGSVAIRAVQKGLEEKTYNVVVLDSVGLTPGAHDESIVVGEDSNNVDTLLADLGEALNVLGDVASRADRGESTGEGEEDDLLVGPLLGGVVVDGDTAGGDLALFLRPGDVTVRAQTVSLEVNWAVER